jgi:small subunit ribosomal protein S6
MKSYEITFIVDPVLSGDEIKATAQTYVDQLKEVGATIVHVDEMGLRQLAYPINKRSSGVYYTVEFNIEDGSPIDKLELALRRDERIMRFLTVRLDKYGVKYNEDKRKGLIGKVKKKSKKSDSKGRDRDRGGRSGGRGRSDRPERSDRSERSESKPKPKKESAKAATATAEEEE